MLKRIAAIFTALFLAVGISVGTASASQAAITNAGKFYLSPASQSVVYVRKVPQAVYAVSPGQYSYDVIPDVDAFMVPYTCYLVISGATYQGGVWQTLSNSITVRNARSYCI